MTREDLSPIMQQAYDALPEGQREKFLEQFGDMRRQMIRGAVAQIQARNTSHNVGTHICRIKKI